MKNALSVDVEDWFQASVFDEVIGYENWDKYENRVEGNLLHTLELLDAKGIKATFFVLGWVAERFPDLVLKLKEEGHEVATHGYAHRLIYKQSKEEFRQDVTKAVEIIEKITGEGVKGYRAPSFSIVVDTFWAWDILSELGIEYDSSVFPIYHDRYGVPSAPRFPYRVKLESGGRFFEFPLSTYRMWGRNMPIAGGGYLRIHPYWFVKRGIRKINSEGMPAIVYFHPWEIDPNPPKVKLKFLSKFRTYTNLDVMEMKIKKLLRDFEFAPVGEVLSSIDFP